MELLTGGWKATVITLVLLVISLEVAANSGIESPSLDDPNNEKPYTTSAKESLEQLKKMEESTLKGWYEMVKKFLHIIKLDDETLFLIMDYIQQVEVFKLPESVLKIVKMNTAFLSLVCIGILYSIAMLLGGIFFLCCRICGRCGAKNSQKQRSTLNCWKTTHKFCLMIMIAFLVVPITCMCIINQHVKQSLPSVKNNATTVFSILSEYANDTQQETDDFVNKRRKGENAEEMTQSFESQFASSISEIINNSKIDEINSIVNWLTNLKEQYTEILNTTSLSNAIHELKAEINKTRELHSPSNCTGTKDVCNFAASQLSIEKVDIEQGMVLIEKEFEKLVGFTDLRSVIEKIQNGTILADIISEKSDDLKNLARDLKYEENEKLKEIQEKMRSMLDQIRNISDSYLKIVKDAVAQTDGYEDYGWWTMLGICLVLLVPVTFLVLGMICGCCGYQKQRHPTKRSSLSNCGGGCLILSVYCFFLIATFLMLLTIVLFIVGGTCETFICVPLYDNDFKLLDKVKNRLVNSSDQSSVFANVIPSKFLKDCQANSPIFKALNMDKYYSSEEGVLQRAVEKRLEESDIDSRLRSTIFDKTTEIRRYLDNFSAALNLTEMKDLPQRVLNASQASVEYIRKFSETVNTAIQDSSTEESKLQTLLVYVNELETEINDLDVKLRTFSSALQNISNDADNYKGKIKEILNDSEDFEQRLPQLVKKHLLKFVMVYAGDIQEEMFSTIGNCSAVWLSFDTARTVVCQFTVNPVNGYWFGLGWSLLFAIPTIIFAVKLSRHYLRMKYDDDVYGHDSAEVLPLEDLNRSKPFSYTNSGPVSWVPHFGQPHNYVVHPASNDHARQFSYK